MLINNIYSYFIKHVNKKIINVIILQPILWLKSTNEVIPFTLIDTNDLGMRGNGTTKNEKICSDKKSVLNVPYVSFVPFAAKFNVHTRMGLKNTDMHTQMTLSFKNTNGHQWARMIGVWGEIELRKIRKNCSDKNSVLNVPKVSYVSFAAKFNVHTRMGLKNTDGHTRMTLSFKNTNGHQWARMIWVWGNGTTKSAYTNGVNEHGFAYSYTNNA